MIIVSACLLGKKCRYDAKDKLSHELLSKLESYNDDQIIAVCPEELGGLPTPRDPAECIEDKLITINGEDVTINYEKGAQMALEIALKANAKLAYLKSKSPMCGHQMIYDGSFSGKLTKGDGIFAKALLMNSIKVEIID